MTDYSKSSVTNRVGNRGVGGSLPLNTNSVNGVPVLISMFMYTQVLMLVLSECSPLEHWGRDVTPGCLTNVIYLLL